MPLFRILCGYYSCFCGEQLAYSPQRMRRMPTYIHELPNWPRFRWDHEALAAHLAAARHHQGRLMGRMEGLGFQLRAEAVCNP